MMLQAREKNTKLLPLQAKTVTQYTIASYVKMIQKVYITNRQKVSVELDMAFWHPSAAALFIWTAGHG
jgi:hypothetical protein